jgi:hypothetical protein
MRKFNHFDLIHVYTCINNRRLLMSLHNAKLFRPSLILASAALLVHIGVATAADSKGDIPQQAKESLAGTTKAHYALQDGKESSPTPDAHELARQLLQGSHPSRGASTDPKPNAAETAGETETQKHPRAYGDAQAAAQELLLGQHPASHASPKGDTEPEKSAVAYGDAQTAAQQLLLGQHHVSAPSPRVARATR